VLGDCRGFVFDLDGCVWHGSTLIPGAGETLTALHRTGRGVALRKSRTSTTSWPAPATTAASSAAPITSTREGP